MNLPLFRPQEDPGPSFAELLRRTGFHEPVQLDVNAGEPFAYIGGRGSIWGGALTAYPFIFLNEWLRSNLSDLPGLNLVIYGLLLILIMIFYPGGVAQFYDFIKSKFKKVEPEAQTTTA